MYFRKFVKKLPDKGEKIKKLVERLETILSQRKQVDKTADLFQQMALSAESARRNQTGNVDEDESGEDEDKDPLKAMAHRCESNIKVKDKRDQRQFINSYEKVIRKAEGKPQKPKFMPHR